MTTTTVLSMLTFLALTSIALDHLFRTLSGSGTSHDQGTTMHGRKRTPDEFPATHDYNPQLSHAEARVVADVVNAQLLEDGIDAGDSPGHFYHMTIRRREVTDVEVRSLGFSIYMRPRSKPAVWVRDGLYYDQNQVEDYAVLVAAFRTACKFGGGHNIRTVDPT
jgi:hypothetical protein